MEFFEFQEVAMYEWAKKFGAMVIVLEHRYYGSSNPVSDFSTSNMKYLSSKQALADAASFIASVNSTIVKPGPWIVFGCSYAGALSAWFRAKYSHLVIGSIAASGPVHATLNFSALLDQWTISASQFPACVETAQSAVQQVYSLLESSAGRLKLKELFSSCNNLTDENDFFFLWQLSQVVGSSDQFQNPPGWPLNHTCQYLTNASDSLSGFAAAFLFNQGADGCVNFNESVFLAQLQRTELSSQDGSRSWWWQKCTEFGFFQGSYPPASIYGTLRVEDLWAFCGKIFGVANMLPDVNDTNAYYGGYELSSSNILFTNGLYDPWHNLSINQNNSRGISSVVYQAGHCAPLTAPTSADPPSLRKARLAAEDAIASWLHSNALGNESLQKKECQRPAKSRD